MGFFSFLSKLFGGGQDSDEAGSGPDGSTPGDSPEENLRNYLKENLPENYVKSKKYAVFTQEAGGVYDVKITLDMLADGSDYNGFGDDNYRELAELESNYLLTDCIANPPVTANFTLELVFSGGRVITVERQAGQAVGFLTAQGQRQQIAF